MCTCVCVCVWVGGSRHQACVRHQQPQAPPSSVLHHPAPSPRDGTHLVVVREGDDGGAHSQDQGGVDLTVGVGGGVGTTLPVIGWMAWVVGVVRAGL